jgi:hypothetical protein
MVGPGRSDDPLSARTAKVLTAWKLYVKNVKPAPPTVRNRELYCSMNFEKGESMGNARVARWSVLGLLVMADLLLARSAAQRHFVNRAASELATESARLREAVETGRGPRELEAAFEEIRQQSSLSILWIQLRDENGTVQARVEPDTQPALPVKLFGYISGTVAVEAFPIEWPAVGSQTRRAGTIEIAARLDRIHIDVRPRPRRQTRSSVRLASLIFVSPRLSNEIHSTL